MGKTSNVGLKRHDFVPGDKRVGFYLCFTPVSGGAGVFSFVRNASSGVFRVCKVRSGGAGMGVPMTGRKVRPSRISRRVFYRNGSYVQNGVRKCSHS